MPDLVINPKIDYGAVELKRVYQKYVWFALLYAAILHGLGIGAYWAPELFPEDEEPTVGVRILKYSDLGPPPSITSANAAPAIAVSAAAVKPSVGIPVPVPDAEVSPEQTIATQQELSQSVGPVDDGSVGGTGGPVIEKDIKIEDEDAPPPDFVPVEKEPVIVKQVPPKYPELATRAGLEGTVWVKIWVDKEGKPKKAVVMRSDAEIFNQAATDAAMQWVFTPAMMKNGPVSVWVSIPFRFRLQGK